MPVSILPPRCSAKAGSVSNTGPATVSGTGSGLMTLLTASALTALLRDRRLGLWPGQSGPLPARARAGLAGSAPEKPGPRPATGPVGLSFWVVGRDSSDRRVGRLSVVTLGGPL